jgi:hypothetical protein
LGDSINYIILKRLIITNVFKNIYNDFIEVMNMLTKKQLAVEETKEIEAITNSLVKEIDVLKKKVAMLKEFLKEDEHIIK